MEVREKALSHLLDSLQNSSEQDQEVAISPIHSLGQVKRLTKILQPRNLGRSLPLSHLLSAQLLTPEPSSRLLPRPALELKVEAAKLHPISEKRPLTRASASQCKAEFPVILIEPKQPHKALRRKLAGRSETAPRTTIRRPSSRLLPIEVKKIPLKEAIRDPTWSTAGRETIKKEFARVICASNGVTVTGSGECVYKYYVGPGNNASLIHQLMKSRKWWTRVKSISESHFAWSQRKESDYLKSIPCVEQYPGQIQTPPFTYVCPLRYRPEGTLQPCLVDISSLHIDFITRSDSYRGLEPTSLLQSDSLRIHNKLECNYNLANKKALFMNMKRYYAARGLDYQTALPLTFHISKGDSDPEFLQFVTAFRRFEEMKRREKWGNNSSSHNLWIVKPGENSNQGRDITIASMLEHVKTEIRRTMSPRSGRPRSYIVQKYIEKPFLYKKRKFDIRCYSLITSINGVMQGYYYPEGYIRTSSKEFDLRSVWDLYVHLTNDAVQKHGEDYGKYETGNKLSYAEFQRYLELRQADLAVVFQQSTLPRIKALVKDTIYATFRKLNPNRRSPTFEVFGYDFMLEADLKPLLIEVNTNPCLELTSAPLLKVIPRMLEGAFRIVLDSLFPEPSNYIKKTNETIPENRWELLFSETVDGAELLQELAVRNTVALVTEEDPSLCQLSDDEDLHSDPEDVSSQA